jgi:hypothetical protein
MLSWERGPKFPLAGIGHLMVLSKSVVIKNGTEAVRSDHASKTLVQTEGSVHDDHTSMIHT